MKRSKNKRKKALEKGAVGLWVRKRVKVMRKRKEKGEKTLAVMRKRKEKRKDAGRLDKCDWALRKRAAEETDKDKQTQAKCSDPAFCGR